MPVLIAIETSDPEDSLNIGYEVHMLAELVHGAE